MSRRSLLSRGKTVEKSRVVITLAPGTTVLPLNLNGTNIKITDKDNTVLYSASATASTNNLAIPAAPTDNQYTITYNKNQAIATSPKEGEYIQTYVFDNGFRLKEAHLKDPKRKMEVDLAYDNWVKAGAEEFPKNVKIIIKEKKTRQIDLEYNSFTFQETNTPFSIPDGYKKKEIK